MHKPRKRFGQHFLIDQHIIQHIIHTLNPKPSDHIVEIGPGQGALSFPLLKIHPNLMAIEIDRDLIPHLKNISVYQADVLDFDFSTLPSPLRIVGNLPYNISTPLLFHLIGYKSYIKDMVFMLQKEVVDRLCAKPNSKDYGRLSVMIQYDFEVEYLFDVPPDAFNPPPKVDSAMVRLVPKAGLPLIDKSLFESLVKEAFQYRRKTIKNALKSHPTMVKLGIDLTRRPETFSVQEYVDIANILAEREC